MDEFQQSVLMEGVKFGFAQIRSVLDHWRERRRKAKEESTEAASAILQVPVALPQALDRPLSGVEMAGSDVEEASGQLKDLYAELAPYAEGREEIDAGNQELQDLVESTRTLLEGLYGKHLTFKGETGRPATGTPVLIDNSTITNITGGSGIGSVVAGSIHGNVTTNVNDGHGWGNRPR